MKIIILKIINDRKCELIIISWRVMTSYADAISIAEEFTSREYLWSLGMSVCSYRSKYNTKGKMNSLFQ